MSKKMLFAIKFLILLLFLFRERKLARAITNDLTQARALAGEFALASAVANEVAALAHKPDRKHDPE
jgi:hypothetical protein